MPAAIVLAAAPIARGQTAKSKVTMGRRLENQPTHAVNSTTAPSCSKAGSEDRALDPIERISEILFGLIMALTFTCSLGVATADNIQIRAMLIGALGCNLAWGIIDAGVFLIARLSEQGRNILKWRAVREAGDTDTAKRIIADSLPPVMASALHPEQLEFMRLRLHQIPEPALPRLRKSDWLGALGICMLCFTATFPIAIPFIFIGDARLALRVSNAVAIAMLFLCGYMFGRCAGFRPIRTGLWMVAIGRLLVSAALALGG
jgi:hypothetical protein